jgi:type I restriction enzyme, S subunit
MTQAWQTVRIGDLGRVVTGKTPSSERPDEFGDAYPFVTPSDIDNTAKFSNTERHLSEAGATTLRNVLLPAKAVCVVCIGATIGKVIMTDRPSFTNQQINSVIVDSSRFDPNYVFYLCKVLSETFQIFAGGAATPIINKAVFSSIKVRTPHLATQQKVAAVLASLDDLIANNQRRIALLENMAEEIYREWFVRMRFPGYATTAHEKGLPKGWRATSAADMVRVLGGGTPSTEVSQYWNGSIPFFSPKDSHEGAFCLATEQYITEQGLEHCSSRYFPEGTIFITARGTVGNLVMAGVPMAMNQSCYALVPAKDKAPYFVFAGLRCAVKVIKGVSNSGVFDNVVMDTFKIIPLIDPGEDLRTRFIEVVKPMYQQSLALRKANLQLITQRDALLPRLISGKLRVDQIDIQLPPSMKADVAEAA